MEICIIISYKHWVDYAVAQLDKAVSYQPQSRGVEWKDDQRRGTSTVNQVSPLTINSQISIGFVTWRKTAGRRNTRFLCWISLVIVAVI